MTKAPVPDQAEKRPRKRIRPLTLVLLWVWAICMFLVIDLFFNVNTLDPIRPRSSIYRGTRVAAHRMVGEPIEEPWDASAGPRPSRQTGGEGAPYGPFARGPGVFGPHDPRWGPAGMEGGERPPRPDAGSAEPAKPTAKPAYRPSPRTITPRVVNLKANLSGTGHGSWTAWNEPEGKAAEGELVNRRRDGRWVWKWSDGKPREERNYRSGTLHGFVRAWYADGQLQLEEEYLEGQPQGRWRAWYGGGKLAWEEQYERGVKTGEFTWFHANGTPSLEGEFRLGKPVGEWVQTDARGQVVDRREFE